ncbi:hypothetical protein J7I98_35885 [Streptomyces sp. ISL-98]|uniref:hypothetical protein n=1 Tax=Streptomyces sp. ISL-98 TaxID=2819192 RepID=UPI001BE82222|nr:hypothetical protein [Streptomyces sp. ISL-98]MBT2511109.1 hypothetical protein [Streptomyces sp. ISL-98]
MAIIVELNMTGATQDQYEQVANKVTGGRGLVKGRSDWPVPGVIAHVAGPGENGWFVVDVWESEEAWQRFAEILVPFAQEVGMPDFQPRIYPAFNVVTE